MSDTARLFSAMVKAFLMLALSGAGCMQLATAAVGDALEVPYTRNPPTIDGVCKIDEWKGAEVQKLVSWSLTNDWIFANSTNRKNYLMLQYDTKGLYGCIDLITETRVVAYQDISLNFDTNHNGWVFNSKSNGVAGEDLNYRGVAQNPPLNGNKIKLRIGTYVARTPLENVIIAGSLSPSPNDLSSQSNIQWEFFIPMEYLKKPQNLTTPYTIGVYILARSHNGGDSGFAYPIFWGSQEQAPLADLILVPEQITTSMSSSSTAGSIATTKTSSASGTLKTTTTERAVPQNIYAFMLSALGLVGVLLLAVGFLHYRNKNQTHISKTVKQYV